MIDQLRPAPHQHVTAPDDRISDRPGKGGMGEVFRATDTRLDRQVALKTLPADVAPSPERRARFEREAKAVAALNHPNIVTIHSVEEHEEVSFITMELVEGRTLAELIRPGGLPPSQIFDIAIPLPRRPASPADRCSPPRWQGAW